MLVPELIINDVPISCINQAAVMYRVPASLIISVLRTENGRKGMAKANSNGSFDYGPMQINTIWVKSLEKSGLTIDDIQNNPCINIMVGSWILSQSISKAPNQWKGVGDYHSHTYVFNQKYQHKVLDNYKVINSVINGPDNDHNLK